MRTPTCFFFSFLKLLNFSFFRRPGAALGLASADTLAVKTSVVTCLERERAGVVISGGKNYTRVKCMQRHASWLQCMQMHVVSVPSYPVDASTNLTRVAIGLAVLHTGRTSVGGVDGGPRCCCHPQDAEAQ